LTGALVYAFVGDDVRSPALLSTSPVISRITFGVALPVIFISGAINSTVLARYIMAHAFEKSDIRFIKDRRGWAVWVAIIAGITIVAWIVGEAIPFFNALLGVIASLFVSGFTIYFPALFWFHLLKEGSWHSSWKNISYSILNAVVFLIGLVFLVGGTYSSVMDIVDGFKAGSVGSSFTCKTSRYV
jgi:hypothetical protein